MNRRVVITGIGVVTPLGNETGSFFEACLGGRNPATPIPDSWRRFADYTSDIWAPLEAVSYVDSEMSRVEQKQLDPVSKNSVHAAFRAIEAAGMTARLVDEKHRTFAIDAAPCHRIGIFMGTGIGGVQTIADSFAHQLLSPFSGRVPPEVQSDWVYPKRFNPFTVPMLMPNAPAANIAIKLGVTGPSLTYTLACAAGTAAIGHGFRAVARGDVDVGIAGGAECLFDPYGTIFRGFDAVKTLAHGYTPRLEANRPFDEERSGFLFSQGGAAVLILENREHAAARGAAPLAEILGYGESSDARSIMMMDRSGKEIARMLDEMHRGADVDPRDVDYVNAHGTGTELNDAVEAAVISDTYRNDVVVNTTKALIGHTIGASGAIEAAVTALSIRHGRVHGMPHLSCPISDLNFARNAHACDIGLAVSHSFAFGGHNTALLFGRV